MIEANWQGVNNATLWKNIGLLERNYALPTVVQSYVTVDYKNTSRNALYINQVGAY